MVFPDRDDYLTIDLSYEKIVEQSAKTVTNLAYSYVKDWGLAEDITQDVFIKVYKNLHTLKEQENLRAWLFRITSNCCKDYLRSSYFKRTFLTNIFRQQPSNYKSISKEEALSLSFQVLNLPVIYKEVILFHYYHDLSIKDISGILDVTESTIKSRLSRGRNRLRKLIERAE